MIISAGPMNRSRSLLIILAWLSLCPSLGRAEVVLDHKLPAGWRFGGFCVSRSGSTAIRLHPDLPDLLLLTQRHPGRLQVFDKAGNLIKDRIIEPGSYPYGFTRDGKLILAWGDENGCSRIKVLAPGLELLFAADAGGRWPEEALLGGEIALIPQVSSDLGLPCSVIDDRTGSEKFRIGPLSKTKPEALFVAIGKDDLFFAGVDKTLFLRSYRDPEKDIWRIEDIGGTIEHLLYLDDDRLAVSYATDDFGARRFMAGNAVIEWRSGRVVFDERGFQIDGKQDDWYRRLHAFVPHLDRGDLVYLLDVGLGIRIPRLPPPANGWDKGRISRIKWPPEGMWRTSPDGVSVQASIQGTFLIWDFGGSVRIERVDNIEDIEKPRD
jgi:hypothetical protein